MANGLVASDREGGTGGGVGAVVGGVEGLDLHHGGLEATGLLHVEGLGDFRILFRIRVKVILCGRGFYIPITLRDKSPYKTVA